LVKNSSESLIFTLTDGGKPLKLRRRRNSVVTNLLNGTCGPWRASQIHAFQNKGLSSLNLSL